MKPFIHDNFLLGNKTAENLFHKYSENKPVIDFHCHLSPELIAGDHQFTNLTQAWLQGDHYKWRAMRTDGVIEKFCTGNAPDFDKFKKWAETVPATVGNPLYHWTHLELLRYFGITELLSPTTAVKIYETASGLLQTKEFSTRSIIRRMNVEMICTTDDPVDNLEHHRKLKDSFEIKVLPAFRPDNVIKTEDPDKFIEYINKLEYASATDIQNFDSLIEALDRQHKYFHEMGCRLSDHGLDRFYYTVFTAKEINKVFRNLLSGKTLSTEDAEKYKTAIMLELCMMNHKRGWTQQFHVGALRNNNSRMFGLMGPDTGWDSVGPTRTL